MPRSLPETDPRPAFPIGAPVNRKPQPDLIPIEGRPNWYRPRNGGDPVYVEPPRKGSVVP